MNQTPGTQQTAQWFIPAADADYGAYSPCRYDLALSTVMPSLKVAVLPMCSLLPDGSDATEYASTDKEITQVPLASGDVRTVECGTGGGHDGSSTCHRRRNNGDLSMNRRASCFDGASKTALDANRRRSNDRETRGEEEISDKCSVRTSTSGDERGGRKRPSTITLACDDWAQNGPEVVGERMSGLKPRHSSDAATPTDKPLGVFATIHESEPHVTRDDESDVEPGDRMLQPFERQLSPRSAAATLPRLGVEPSLTVAGGQTKGSVYEFCSQLFRMRSHSEANVSSPTKGDAAADAQTGKTGRSPSLAVVVERSSGVRQLFARFFPHSTPSADNHRHQSSPVLQRWSRRATDNEPTSAADGAATGGIVDHAQATTAGVRPLNATAAPLATIDGPRPVSPTIDNRSGGRRTNVSTR
jgi:hypothetical protein